MPRWLIYALGGGLGHLVRGLALARAASRSGVRVRLLTNSPFAGLVPLADELDGECVVIDASAQKSEVAARVRTELERRDFDVLVVDTFPRGLAGELAEVDMATPRVLVHRDLSPAYVERFALREVVSNYELLLLPGERGPLADAGKAVVETAPWLVRDADELLSADDARAALAIDGDRPVVGVVASGNDSEVAEAEAQAVHLAALLGERGAVRLLSLTASLTYWPLIRLLPGIDLLVGSGGYNTVVEARAVGVPLLAMARERLYDRQERRLRPEERVEREELSARMTAVERRVAIVAYDNGVHAAVASILAL